MTTEKNKLGEGVASTSSIMGRSEMPEVNFQGESLSLSQVENYKEILMPYSEILQPGDLFDRVMNLVDKLSSLLSEREKFNNLTTDAGKSITEEYKKILAEINPPRV